MADPTLADVMASLVSLHAKVDNITFLTRTNLYQELQMANVLDTVTAQVTALQSAVANETTIDQSAITLITGLGGQITALAAQLAAAIANQADPAQVQAIADQLSRLGSTVTGNATALAGAVAANTPSAP